MDYRAFLGAREPIVLPYFGGTRVDAPDRRLRVAASPSNSNPNPQPLAPGWWRFRIEGRRALPVEPAPPADLSALPALRGHFVSGWVVASGRELGHLALPPDDEPPALSRITARRWYSGDWLFDTLDFEDEAELAARQAFEDRRPLGDIKGVAPSLRAAFGYALGLATAAELRLPLSIRELQPVVVAIADRGPEVIREYYDRMLEQRRREQAAARERAREFALANAAGRARVIERARGQRERCDDVLADAGARMTGFRRLAGGEELEVTYTVDGTRIISTVEPGSLQVIDPGLCLGHNSEHRLLTLDAMPSVVREAIETGRLNIMRW
jgi:hypothetical protein